MAYRFIVGGLFSAFLLVNWSTCPALVQADGGIPKVKAEKQRTEVRVRVGDQVRLPCPVEWTPSLLLEWFKDGVAVERSMDNARPQRKSLLIVNATRDNRGVYVCRAVNGFGSAEVSIRLDVLRQPGDNGNDEYNDDDGNGDGDDEQSSRVRGNGEDSSPTQPGRKPEFVELYSPPHNKNFTQCPEMSSVRFRCAVRGQPPPDVRWLKDGRELGIADRDSAPTPIRPKGNGSGGGGGGLSGVGAGATLFLKNLQQHHTGNYTCVASNAYGTINATFVLDVISRTPKKPVLTDGHPLNTSVEFGGTASFQCRVKSDAFPHIQWLKRMDDPVHQNQLSAEQQQLHNNGTIVFEGSRFKVLKSSEVVERNEGLYLNKLLLTEVQESDSGTYVCMAANTMGYSFKSAHLTVTSNHGPWQVMSDVYDGSSSVYHQGVSVAKFPATLVVVVPLTVIASLLFVFVVLQCRRHSSPIDGVNKTVAAVTASGINASSARKPIPPQTTTTTTSVINNCQKMTTAAAAPLLGTSAESHQFVDMPSQRLLGGQSNKPMTWHAAVAHHVQGNNAPSSHQTTGSGASRRSGGAATPNSSLRDSCSANSVGTSSLPKVHQHHHYRQHHHQHVYYGQDDWSSPFQC